MNYIFIIKEKIKMIFKKQQNKAMIKKNNCANKGNTKFIHRPVT